MVVLKTHSVHCVAPCFLLLSLLCFEGRHHGLQLTATDCKIRKIHGTPITAPPIYGKPAYYPTLVSVATETLPEAHRPLELLKIFVFCIQKSSGALFCFFLLGAEPKLVAHTNVG